MEVLRFLSDFVEPCLTSYNLPLPPRAPPWAANEKYKPMVTPRPLLNLIHPLGIGWECHILQ